MLPFLQLPSCHYKTSTITTPHGGKAREDHAWLSSSDQSFTASFFIELSLAANSPLAALAAATIFFSREPQGEAVEEETVGAMIKAKIRSGVSLTPTASELRAAPSPHSHRLLIQPGIRHHAETDRSSYCHRQYQLSSFPLRYFPSTSNPVRAPLRWSCILTTTLHRPSPINKNPAPSKTAFQSLLWQPRRRLARPTSSCPYPPAFPPAQTVCYLKAHPPLLPWRFISATYNSSHNATFQICPGHRLCEEQQMQTSCKTKN